MIILLFVGFILFMNWVLVSIGKKINIINIVMQLVGAMIIAPIISLFLPEIHINQIAASPNIKTIYDICFVILIAYILHDNIDFPYPIKNLKLVLPSFLIPFSCGVFSSILWIGHFQLQNAVVFGIIFSITAVPVLYMYLKGFNYNKDSMKFFIQAAVMIDIISWITHSLISDFNNSIIYLILGAVLLAYLTYKINKNLSGLILFIILFITSYFKSNILLVGVIYVISSSYLKMPINLILSDILINRLNNYLFIPIILFIGLFKINWGEIHPVFNYKLIILILLPLFSKIAGNYVGLYLLNKKDKLNSSILLNTRGLTEIVFLNLVFGMKIIDSYTYVIFMVMSIICTILPVFFCKKQN